MWRWPSGPAAPSGCNFRVCRTWLSFGARPARDLKQPEPGSQETRLCFVSPRPRSVRRLPSSRQSSTAIESPPPLPCAPQLLRSSTTAMAASPPLSLHAALRRRQDSGGGGVGARDGQHVLVPMRADAAGGGRWPRNVRGAGGSNGSAAKYARSFGYTPVSMKPVTTSMAPPLARPGRVSPAHLAAETAVRHGATRWARGASDGGHWDAGPARLRGRELSSRRRRRRPQPAALIRALARAWRGGCVGDLARAMAAVMTEPSVARRPWTSIAVGAASSNNSSHGSSTTTKCRCTP